MSAIVTRAGVVADNKAADYDQISLGVLGVFCAYIITWFLQLGDRIAILGAIRIEFILAIILIGCALMCKRQQLPEKTNLHAYLAWFFFVLIIQVPFSANFDFSWTIFVDRVVKFAFMAVFISTFVRSPKAMKFFLFALLLAWFKLGQEGLLGQITGSKVWENQGVMRLHGPTGLYGHPNSYSGFALGTLPFIYYLFPLANRWQKIFLLVMLVFALNIILNTGSRTGYIGFFGFALFVFARSQYKMKFLIGFTAAFLIALPYIPDQYIQRFQSIGGEEKEGHSKEVRIVILKDAAIIFAEHPFGIGIAAFPTVRMARFGRFQDTHNLYMEVLTNLGIQGFIVWALLIAALFKNIRRLNGQLRAQLERLKPLKDAETGKYPPPVAEHEWNVRLILAVLSAVTTYLLIRLVVGFFGMDLYEIYWWFSLGIVLAAHNMCQIAGRITDRLVGGGAQAVKT